MGGGLGSMGIANGRKEHKKAQRGGVALPSWAAERCLGGTDEAGVARRGQPTMPPELRKIPSNIILTAWALLAFS